MTCYEHKDDLGMVLARCDGEYYIGHRDRCPKCGAGGWVSGMEYEAAGYDIVERKWHTRPDGWRREIGRIEHGVRAYHPRGWLVGFADEEPSVRAPTKEAALSVLRKRWEAEHVDMLNPPEPGAPDDGGVLGEIFMGNPVVLLGNRLPPDPPPIEEITLEYARDHLTEKGRYLCDGKPCTAFLYTVDWLVLFYDDGRSGNAWIGDEFLVAMPAVGTLFRDPSGDVWRVTSQGRWATVEDGRRERALDWSEVMGWAIVDHPVDAQMSKALLGTTSETRVEIGARYAHRETGDVWMAVGVTNKGVCLSNGGAAWFFSRDQLVDEFREIVSPHHEGDRLRYMDQWWTVDRVYYTGIQITSDDGGGRLVVAHDNPDLVRASD